VADSGTQVSPTTDPASGIVCDGWNTPVNDLIALGLQTEVLRRLKAFTSAADRTVYVVGHSRGGSLVSSTLLLLLLLLCISLLVLLLLLLLMPAAAAVVVVVVCLQLLHALHPAYPYQHRHIQQG
jgi:alpha-beta hydrolase superfamily lysophospholipase